MKVGRADRDIKKSFVISFGSQMAWFDNKMIRSGWSEGGLVEV